MNILETMTLCGNTPVAFSKESCEKAINWFEQNINQAQAGVAGIEETLNNLELSIQIKSKEDFFNLCGATEKGLTDFKKKYKLFDTNIGAFNLDITDILMCKWEPNNYYKTIHCETGPYISNHIGPRWWNRVFSWMIYLNDIKHGGGTEFIYQDITTIPRAGDFIIFPSGASHMHRGENAPFETKYIITGHFIYV